MIGAALLAIVLWSAAGFSWFGYGFNWETQTSAARMSNELLVENLAKICESQALKSVGAEASIKKLATVQSWKQSTFVKEAGWATMPGSERAENGVADLCAEKLLKT
jgi:hypothetical protein